MLLHLSVRRLSLYHGGEARDLKLEIQGTPLKGKDMYFFDFFINNGRICMGFLQTI